MLKQQFKTAALILSLSVSLGTAGCDSSSAPAEDDGSGFDAAPSFTPSSDESLSDYVINTFSDNGRDITVDPESIDFGADGTTYEQGDTDKTTFTLTNNSGATRTFKFQIYAISSGFTILDENEDNLGAWKSIVIADGASETFNVQFTADLFGTQTSYLTVTADVEGFIRLPFRATVTGDADFRLIPTGYACSNEDAPSVASLDFLKVAYGNSRTQGIKLCNSGGEDVKINSAALENDDSGELSAVFTGTEFETFGWSSNDDITAIFASGFDPGSTTVSAPAYVDCGGTVVNAASDYDVGIHNGGALDAITIGTAGFLWMDVVFTPSVDMQAGDGELCDPLSINAKLTLNTSQGVIEIPLLGATAGSEPVLEMSYRVAGYETDDDGDSDTAGVPYYRPIVLTSDGAAIVYDTTEIFTDWVSENYQDAEIVIKNSGARTLEFAGGRLYGFFEYAANTDGSTYQFPIAVEPGQSQTITIRYTPTPAPEDAPAKDDPATWDFGQFYFTHNAGNDGPEGKITLVGEQEAGAAAEVTYNGADMLQYAEVKTDENGEVILDDDGNPTYIYTKNFCVVNTNPEENKIWDDSSFTFAVSNNSKLAGNDLTVRWSVESDSSEKIPAGYFTPISEETFSIAPGELGSFTFTLTLDSSVTAGDTVTGKIRITTAFAEEIWDQYSEYAYADERETEYAIPFQATASDGNNCEFDSTELAKDDFKGTVTFVVDRLSMILTDLPEATRSYPSFKFHLPLEIDSEKGTARIAKKIEFDYSGKPQRGKQITSPLHQSTGISGCAVLPTNPYRLRDDRYSWNGPRAECGELIAKGTQDGDITFYGDQACMKNDGGKDYVDASTGESKVVFYSEFAMIDDACEVQYYGKFSTFAFDPETETIRDVFKRSEASPNENEEFYEDIYGAFRYDTYITFLKETTCGGATYASGGQPETITDTDAIKACYYEFAADTGGTRRVDGFITECAEFNFYMDEGMDLTDVDLEDPDYDTWTGAGRWEPHKDEEENIVEGQYDISLYNVHIQAFVLGAADRVSFFGHTGHLLFSDLYITFTTKRVADKDIDNEDWQEMIAVNTRKDFSKQQVYLKEGELYDVYKYMYDDGLNSLMTNVINPFDSRLELGKDRGNFRFTEDGERRVLSGYPVNFEENNMLVLAGLGSFGGVGNTAPPFTKQDSATGKGKPLYFSFHGCLVNSEDPDPNQGCQSYALDSTPDNDDTDLLIKKYIEAGEIPAEEEAVTGYDCDDLTQGSLTADDPLDDFGTSAASMGCINYTIFGIDRNRYTNYYDPTSDTLLYNAYGQYYTAGDEIAGAPLAADDPQDFDEYTISDYKCGIGM